MTDLSNQVQSSDPAIIRFWQRIPIVIRAILLGLFVFEVGNVASIASLTIIPAPWSIVVVGGILWLYWKYFSGNWRPKVTAEARRYNFRGLKLSGAVWKWGLIAAMLLVIVWQAGLVTTFRIIEFPQEAFTSEYNLGDAPLWLAWLFIVMAALVAGITEETGFRGYMQLPLEKRYGPIVGITIVSIVFLVLHLNQAWATSVLINLFAVSVMFGILTYTTGSLIPAIISHTVLDIFNFSFWWTDVAGRFERQTISETGIDSHFVIWALILIASIALFIVCIRKLLALRQQT